MAVPQNELVFLPLGGSGEIGMNFNAYGFGPADDRKWIIVDCGVLFGREGNTPGVDLILPDIRYLAEQPENILGMVLTHAHEDHIGAIGQLWPQLRCPLFATPFTAWLIRDKLLEADLGDQIEVTHIPQGGHISLGPFEIDLISITHSILEPNALSIRTPLGTVVHTGDWKLDPEPLLGDVTNADALQKLGDEGVLAVVCDSTNALVPGHTGSEGQVKETLAHVITGLKGRIAVTAFASNVARLHSIGLAARAAKREIVLVGRSMHRIVNAARETGYLQDFPPVWSEEDGADLPPHRVLYLCTGSQGESRSALARIAAGEHNRVKLGPGDTVIFSSRVIPGNELSIFEMQNNLAAQGVEILTDHDHDIHVSGHPARDELAQMYRWTRPQIAVPVHGERRHQEEHARLARSLQVPQTVVPENGQLFRLAPGRASLIDEVPSGRLHLDGTALVAEGEGYARNRRALGFAGLIAVTLVLDAKGRLAAEPAILFEGIPKEIHDPVRAALDGILRRHNPKRDDDKHLKESVRRIVRRAALDAWGKKPVARVETIFL